MSAPEVTARALEELDSGEFDVMILNFANCDMVGHTGVIPAAVKAVHTVDECVKKITDKILSMGGSALVTADHGNADKMLDTDGSPFTAHTTNPVPVILVSDKYKGAALRKDGILADLAPTLLEVMGLPIPAEMTGKSLIEKVTPPLVAAKPAGPPPRSLRLDRSACVSSSHKSFASHDLCGSPKKGSNALPLPPSPRVSKRFLDLSNSLF